MQCHLFVIVSGHHQIGARTLPFNVPMACHMLRKYTVSQDTIKLDCYIN